MIGQTLGHYKILEKLGEGGMGKVYLAEDTTLKREVALKVLPSEVASIQDRLKRFQREAESLAALNHPNIVHVYSVEEVDGVHFLTMELVEGRNLDQLIPRGGLPLEQFFDLAIPLADALSEAHEGGIVHRDLKPNNIMVDLKGRPKILDFGLAKLRDPAPSPVESDAPTEIMTKPGAVIGTYPYMSPEQLNGNDATPLSDVFALGVILFKMATGQYPFQGKPPGVLIASIIYDDPRAIDSLRTELPHHLDRIIQHCLEKDPTRRFQSALDVRNELEALRSEIHNPPIPPPSKEHPLRSQTLRIGGAAAIIAALVIGYSVIRSPGGEPSAESPATFTELRLTRNPETRPAFGEISPDGGYLAFGDPTGLYVQDLESGELRQLSELASRDYLSWHPDGRSILLTTPTEEDSVSAVWRVSTLTGERELMQDAVLFGRFSPDGKSIAFVSENGRELLLTSSSGEDPLSLLELPQGQRLHSITWSPLGMRVAYLLWDRTADPSTASIGTVDLAKHQSTEVLRDAKLYFPHAEGGIHWQSQGYLLYVTRGGPSVGSELWRLRINEESGVGAGEPEHLRTWAEYNSSYPSSSKTGTRLAINKRVDLSDVYVGKLDTSGVGLDDLEAITSFQGTDHPIGWLSPTEVLFRSERYGRSLLLRQRLDTAEAEPIPGPIPEGIWGEKLSPDREWILAQQQLASDESISGIQRVLRFPVAGGPAVVVHTVDCTTAEECSFHFDCATLESGSCVLGEELAGELTFFDLSPTEGRKGELARVSLLEKENRDPWMLSPSGDRIVLPLTFDSLLIMSLSSGSIDRIEVGSAYVVRYPNWTASGDALIFSGVSTHEFSLTRLELDGTARVIWKSRAAWVTRTLPSPDGRHLMAHGWSLRSDVWMLCSDCPSELP